MPSSTSASESSRSATMQSMRNQVDSKVRIMTHYGQPTIEINLRGTEGPRNTWVTSYSTMDTLEGTVTIVAAHDTMFEDIDIAFVGTSQVFVDTLTTTPSMTGRTEADHRFLVLRQPIPESDFPSPRMFEAGVTYEFPFTFTIPNLLLPKSCSHQVSSDHVRDCHLMLPPSLGDPDLAGFGSTLLDDMAPAMSKITYAIKVRIAQQRGTEGISILGEKSKKVRIKPALIEQPPLNIDGNKEYRPRQEKTVRKGLFKGKLGTLSAAAIQPAALVIPGARTTHNTPINTMAKLLLRFDPIEESSAPPKLGSLSTKLKVTTYYASSPRQNFPSRMTVGFDVSQGAYSENIALSTLCIASAQWEKQTAAANVALQESLERRDSGISDYSTMSNAQAAFTTGILPSSKDYKNSTFYTTQILVPVTLPLTKNFIPTFHSCLVSRTYTLGIHFSAHGTQSLHLKVPVQICAQASDTGIENARARRAEETLFRASGVAPPPSFDESNASSPLRTRSVGAREESPPGYSAFAPLRRRGASLAA
ncbi:arrestin [Ampelomyces quisqualis]|uniref:Arrestin n=1 Tax=Ampelomyces quisqualis TaxID=50730 RepID=A0A6A5QFB0_AMPQU|nr:arrestin [Ampelomyces quisqualis]